MRLKHRAPGTEIQKPARMEPLAEGPASVPKKFSDEEISKFLALRQELIKAGQNDKQVAQAVAERFGEDQDTLYRKFMKLTSKGLITKNPNRPPREEFTDDENEAIKRRRREMAAAGMKDKSISRVLAKEMNRSVQTMNVKIMRWIESGVLPPNPNKVACRQIRAEEIELIKSRREEMMREGLQDETIARRIASENGMSMSSIGALIRRLVRKGVLPENPSKRKHLDDTQRQEVLSKWGELIHTGMLDSHIFKRISEDTGIRIYVVRSAIIMAIASGKAEPNPHKNPRRKPSSPIIRRSRDPNGTPKIKGPADPDRKSARPNKDRHSLDSEEISRLIERRNSLMKEGYNDKRITMMVSSEFERTPRSIEVSIKRLVREGALLKNPNRNFIFTPSDVEWMKAARSKLIGEGLSDIGISRMLASQMNGKAAASIMKKIEESVDSGMFERNPNIQSRADAAITQANPNKRRLIFKEEDVPVAMKARDDLIQSGKSEFEIARIMEQRFGGNAASIRNYLWRQVKSGAIRANPNKDKFKIIGEEMVRLKAKRRILIAEGRTDSEIGKLLCKEFGKKGHALSEEMRKLVLEGTIEPNPNKKARRDNGRQKNFYSAMDDEAFVVYAREIYKKSGCRVPTDLKEKDSGLYEALRQRKLLQALAPTDPAKHKEAVDGVLEALDTFDDEK